MTCTLFMLFTLCFIVWKKTKVYCLSTSVFTFTLILPEKNCQVSSYTCSWYKDSTWKQLSHLPRLVAVGTSCFWADPSLPGRSGGLSGFIHQFRQNHHLYSKVNAFMKNSFSLIFNIFAHVIITLTLLQSSMTLKV